MKLRPAACWATRTWPGPGEVTSNSSQTSWSGPPVWWTLMAWGIGALHHLAGQKKSPAGREPGGASDLAWDQAPPASAASSSRATMLVILIIGLTAGPAVSL